MATSRAAWAGLKVRVIAIFTALSIYIYAYMSIYLSVCLSVCLSVRVCLFSNQTTGQLPSFCGDDISCKWFWYCLSLCCLCASVCLSLILPCPFQLGQAGSSGVLSFWKAAIPGS